MSTGGEVSVEFLRRKLAEAQSQSTPLHSGGGGGTYDDMSTMELRERLARLEGGNSSLKWGVGVVSAALLAAAAISVAVALYLAGQVSNLSTRVEALPNEISSNLMELNRTLLQAVEAGRAEPVVVVTPGAPPIE